MSFSDFICTFAMSFRINYSVAEIRVISPDMQFLVPGSQAIQHATASTTQRGRRHDNTLPHSIYQSEVPANTYTC